MQYKKYQHIERLDHQNVRGILDGRCFLFPKIDGTNGSVWLGDDGQIHAGSRNRDLTEEQDNGNFYKSIKDDEKIKMFFVDHPEMRLYGEWLIPHSLKTYREDAWRKFYVFDVEYADELLNYAFYSELLDKYSIEYIRPIVEVILPEKENLLKYLESNTFLIKDGEGAGEGIVIKNYEYRNKDGKQIWAKIVRNEFKEKNRKEFGHNEGKASESVEKKIAEKYCTESLIDKEYAKINLEKGGWDSKYIPMLLGKVFNSIVSDTIWEILKEYKFPTVDFKELQRYINYNIKKIKPEVF
jgi:hypothetical protein